MDGCFMQCCLCLLYTSFYSRLQNPTCDTVARKIAAMEGGTAAMLTSSGQAATFYAMFNICAVSYTHLMTYVPGAGPCYRCVFKNPPPKDAVPTCKQAGVIGAMGGVIGSLQAMEAIKYLIGVGELLTGYPVSYTHLDVYKRQRQRSTI